MSNRGAAMRRHDVSSRLAERSDAPRRARPASGEPGPLAVAGYIADMTAQLESMATAAHLDLLAYFLAMARAEGEAASRVDAASAGEDAPAC